MPKGYVALRRLARLRGQGPHLYNHPDYRTALNRRRAILAIRKVLANGQRAEHGTCNSEDHEASRRKEVETVCAKGGA